MASYVCIWGPFDMKRLETALRGETGRGNVGGRGFEAGPFMSAVIIVRLKVGHTLWACSHKEQECSHCAGRLAGWEYYGRAELCRARHGQELPQCLTTHSAASVCIHFHYLIAMCMLIICDSVWEAVLCRVRLRYGADHRLSTDFHPTPLYLWAISCVTDQYSTVCQPMDPSWRM